VHEQARDRLVAHHVGDFGLLGVGRQVANRRDPLLDPVEGLPHRRAFRKLQRHQGDALGGGRGHLVQAVDCAQGLLQRHRDRALDVLGGRPLPDDPDRDDLHLEAGEELGVQAAERPQAGDDHRRHQQVRRDRVAREDAEEVVAVAEAASHA